MRYVSKLNEILWIIKSTLVEHEYVAEIFPLNRTKVSDKFDKFDIFEDLEFEERKIINKKRVDYKRYINRSRG
jgi:adenylate cyclase class IV